MGPGLVIKACLQGAFSLMVFGWTQILIDLQPLAVIITGKGELHGFTHTYVGATLVAVIAAPTGKYFGEFGLRILRLPQYNPITWWVAWSSALIGGYSHVLIDGIMHSDMRPLWPFSDRLLLYAVIDVDWLHIVCLASAVIGAVGFYLIESLRATR